MKAAPTRGQDGASTAERLLVEAAALFRERGYANATTRELAERLGIRKASLYYHIETKEDLLYALCAESTRRVTEAVAAVAEQHEGLDRLRRMIETHLVTAVRDRDMHTTGLLEMRSLSRERRGEVIASRDRYEQLLRRVIADEQAAGRLRDDVDARYLALTLLNLLNWTLFWYAPDGEMDAATLGATLASVYVDGAAARPARRARAARRSARTAPASENAGRAPRRRSSRRTR